MLVSIREVVGQFKRDWTESLSDEAIGQVDLSKAAQGPESAWESGAHRARLLAGSSPVLRRWLEFLDAG